MCPDRIFNSDPLHAPSVRHGLLRLCLRTIAHKLPFVFELAYKLSPVSDEYTLDTRWLLQWQITRPAQPYSRTATSSRICHTHSFWDRVWGRARGQHCTAMSNDRRLCAGLRSNYSTADSQLAWVKSRKKQHRHLWRQRSLSVRCRPYVMLRNDESFSAILSRSFWYCLFASLVAKCATCYENLFSLSVSIDSVAKL